MTRILIAEDLAAERLQLENYLQEYARGRDIEIDVASYADGTDLLEAYNGGADLIFLDIDMQHMDGITVARRIRQFDDTVRIIFITRMVQHALEGYEVQASDYMIKPVAFDLFCVKMDRIFRRIGTETGEQVHIRSSRGEQHILHVREITHAETQGKHVVIHLASWPDGSGNVETALPMYQLERQLQGKPFFRCHSAYLVNLRFVTGYSQTDVFLGERQIPLSKHRRRGFLDALTAYHTARI